MFKCVLYVFARVNCLIAVIICVIAFVFGLLSDSVILTNNDYETEQWPPAVNCYNKQLMGLYYKAETSSLDVFCDQSRHLCPVNLSDSEYRPLGL